jgi:F-type H+-transporting ATPase subunit epsilon
MATLKLEIVTPEAKTYSEDVDMVTLPGAEGEMGIYPNHVPLMTRLAPGSWRSARGLWRSPAPELRL